VIAMPGIASACVNDQVLVPRAKVVDGLPYIASALYAVDAGSGRLGSVAPVHPLARRCLLISIEYADIGAIDPEVGRGVDDHRRLAGPALLSRKQQFHAGILWMAPTPDADRRQVAVSSKALRMRLVDIGVGAKPLIASGRHRGAAQGSDWLRVATAGIEEHRPASAGVDRCR